MRMCSTKKRKGDIKDMEKLWVNMCEKECVDIYVYRKIKHKHMKPFGVMYVVYLMAFLYIVTYTSHTCSYVCVFSSANTQPSLWGCGTQSVCVVVYSYFIAARFVAQSSNNNKTIKIPFTWLSNWYETQGLGRGGLKE